MPVITLLIFLGSPVTAHTVKKDAGVGATFHIEPDHNPRAGEPAMAWFALTHPGGKLIPLEQCDCQLAVYSQAAVAQANQSAILNPPLKSISVEQYQQIPGADIVFPQAGIYQLVITGHPKAGADFQPFKLSYAVTVLPGNAIALKKTPENQSHSQQGFPGFWAIGALTLILSLILFLVNFFRKKI